MSVNPRVSSENTSEESKKSSSGSIQFLKNKIAPAGLYRRLKKEMQNVPILMGKTFKVFKLQKKQAQQYNQPSDQLSKIDSGLTIKEEQSGKIQDSKNDSSLRS